VTTYSALLRIAIVVELFQELAARQAKPISTFDHFCVKCKSRRSFCCVTEVRTRLGQKALQGYCRVCGCKSIKFLSSPVLVSIPHRPRSNLLNQVSTGAAKTSNVGRRDLIDRFGLDRVKAAFTNISDIRELAQIFGCNRVTVYRTARKLKRMQLGQVIREPTDELLQQEDAQRWSEWLKTRLPKHYGWFVGVVEEIWQKCWNKQHIITILSKDEHGESNIIQALNYINNNFSQGKKFNAIVTLRSLIRYGFGDPAWLQRHLTTKGKKPNPRKIPVLRLPEFPTLWNETIELAKQIAHENERDEIELILNIKTATGMRTGSIRDERELWGTRIGEGKSSIYIHAGNVVWMVYSKAGETWEISLLPDKVKKMLLNYVRRHGLRQGDPLIKMKTARANQILAEASSKVLNYRLRLHDCRKIFITYLKRAGVGIEDVVSPSCSCPFGVTWKDANTTYRHYLEIVDTDQIAAHKKFSDVFFS